ncbi:MAG: LON peptidase substrate-binding domain-containing protein [Polyangiaceae bacterium]|jgi:ATP-dependent Lon protease|nr:LON peptidase substrate-binding domain-containing protein [Polyangiaceae bacterium]
MPRPDLPPLALAELPLFPLPHTVLFPGALLPLHVFEPRYRAMTKHCLATHRAMAVVLITDPRPERAPRSERGPMSERSPFSEHPPYSEREQLAIAPVASAGVIVEAAELPDGRFNLLLRGEARVRLTELPFMPPFRRAEAVVIPDEGEEPLEHDLLALLSLVASFTATIRAQNAAFDFQLPPNLPGSLASNLVAQHLVLDAGARQELLETVDPRERVRRTLDVLALQHSALGKRSGKAAN